MIRSIYHLKKSENVERLKGEFAIFFIGVSNAPKYDFKWTEDESLTDRFLPEILTCITHVGHAMNTLRT